MRIRGVIVFFALGLPASLLGQTLKNVLDVSATLVETLFVVSVSRMFV